MSSKSVLIFLTGLVTGTVIARRYFVSITITPYSGEIEEDTSDE